MNRIAVSLITLFAIVTNGYSQQGSSSFEYLDSPDKLNTESGDQPYIAFNGIHGAGAMFARLFSYNTTGVAKNSTIYVQEFDGRLKVKYTKLVPNLDTVLVGNAKATRIFYVGGELHFCYYRLAGQDQFFYIFKSSVDHDSLTLKLIHVEQVQGSLFDEERFFNNTVLGYDYSYDFTASPNGQIVLLTVVGSRRTGEKNKLLLRTFRSNLESIWQKQIDLPASPNVFMLKNATQQTIESLKQDYSFRPYAINQVMNGLPQLTGTVLDDASNAFVRIDETTEVKKAFGIQYRVPSRARNWYSFYDVGSRVVTQCNAGDQMTLDAAISRDSLTVYSCVPRQDQARIPSFRVSALPLLPATAARASAEFVVNAIARDSMRNVYLVITRRREKDERGDGFQLLKLAPDGALVKQQFIAIKNFNEILGTRLEGDQFTVLYSAMPKAQVVTGFNAMLREFTSYLLMVTLDGNGNVATSEIRKIAGEGPNLVYRQGSTLLMAWYSHEDKKLASYALLKTVDH